MPRNILYLSHVVILLTIFCSPGYGQSDFWKQTNGPFGGRVNVLSINNQGHVFAGTEGGALFRSSDAGNNWSRLNGGLLNTSVLTLAVSETNIVFAGSQGAGVFKSTGPTTTVTDHSLGLPVVFTIKQNYPNPFNPSTTINYYVSSAAKVELKIYNQLGQEIRTLENSVQTNGAHQTLWDGRDGNGNSVSSGLYFYRLKAGSFVETRKMLLIR